MGRSSERIATRVAAIFVALPMAIVGAMMFLVGIELVKCSRDLRFNRQLVPVAATLAGSLLANMAVGFIAGLAVHYLLCRNARGARAAQ